MNEIEICKSGNPAAYDLLAFVAGICQSKPKENYEYAEVISVSPSKDGDKVFFSATDSKRLHVSAVSVGAKHMCLPRFLEYGTFKPKMTKNSIVFTPKTPEYCGGHMVPFPDWRKVISEEDVVAENPSAYWLSIIGSAFVRKQDPSWLIGSLAVNGIQLNCSFAQDAIGAGDSSIVSVYQGDYTHDFKHKKNWTGSEQRDYTNQQIANIFTGPVMLKSYCAVAGSSLGVQAAVIMPTLSSAFETVKHPFRSAKGMAKLASRFFNPELFADRKSVESKIRQMHPHIAN